MKIGHFDVIDMKKTWLKIESEALANDWARPIYIALDWLGKNDLLTQVGLSMYDVDYKDLELNSECIKEEVVDFVDKNIEKWYLEQGAFSAFVGAFNIDKDFKLLDELYEKWKQEKL